MLLRDMLRLFDDGTRSSQQVFFSSGSTASYSSLPLLKTRLEEKNEVDAHKSSGPSSSFSSCQGLRHCICIFHRRRQGSKSRTNSIVTIPGVPPAVLLLVTVDSTVFLPCIVEDKAREKEHTQSQRSRQQLFRIFLSFIAEDERRLDWDTLSMLCPGDPDKPSIYPASHQSSDLTLRLHSLQTAHFTEQGVDSSLRPTTAFILASHFHLAAPSDIHVHKAGLSLLSDMCAHHSSDRSSHAKLSISSRMYCHYFTLVDMSTETPCKHHHLTKVTILSIRGLGRK